MKGKPRGGKGRTKDYEGEGDGFELVMLAGSTSTSIFRPVPVFIDGEYVN
jgi:hypothetical protein